MHSISSWNPLTRTHVVGLASCIRDYFKYAKDRDGHSKWAPNPLERVNVSVVTINGNPQFSGPMSPELRGALEERFPHFGSAISKFGGNNEIRNGST